jgi:uncharacterized protein Usg
METLENQLCKDFRLTTAEIYYHMPDFPELLQSYIWQEYDIAPQFPELNRFLRFWTKELDGKLHSVFVASKEIITPGDIKFYETEITIQ